MAGSELGRKPQCSARCLLGIVVPGQAPPLALRRLRAPGTELACATACCRPWAGTLQTGSAVRSVQCAGELHTRGKLFLSGLPASFLLPDDKRGPPCMQKGAKPRASLRRPSRSRKSSLFFAVPTVTSLLMLITACCVHCSGRPVLGLTLHFSISCQTDAAKQRSGRGCLWGSAVANKISGLPLPHWLRNLKAGGTSVKPWFSDL